MRVIGHGIDLVSVPRIARLLDQHGEHFLARCFGPEERGHAPFSRRRAEHLAARFAAKEAAMKALGTGLSDGVSWLDFQVRSLNSGAPTLDVRGRAREIALARGIGRWIVSLTHTDELAMASVMAVSE